ncbi:hypothetical protein PG993_006290 [Apiospora rasikravindrae]|uniref:Uncharacterized protein n=1 Tax=Apiospora rasikravindrae TaxID=990691 RepID=A0ABR1T5S3_9PEZI
MLRRTHEPRPSLRDKLVTKLERSLETVQTPSPTALRDPSMGALTSSPSFDYSWQIFDQASLQQVTYPGWPLGAGLQGVCNERRETGIWVPLLNGVAMREVILFRVWSGMPRGAVLG